MKDKNRTRAHHALVQTMKEKNRRPAHQALVMMCFDLANDLESALNPDVQVGRARTLGPATASASKYTDEGWPADNSEITGSMQLSKVINLGTAKQENAKTSADILGELIAACDKAFFEDNQSELALDLGEQVLVTTPFIDGSDDIPGDDVFFTTKIKFTASKKS